MTAKVKIEDRMFNILKRIGTNDNQFFTVDNILVNDYGVYFCEDNAPYKLRHYYSFAENSMAKLGLEQNDFIFDDQYCKNNHNDYFIRLKFNINQDFFYIKEFKDIDILANYAKDVLPEEITKNGIEIFFEERDGVLDMYYSFSVIMMDELQYYRFLSRSTDIANDDLFLTRMLEYISFKQKGLFTMQDLKKDFKTCMDNLKLIDY
jgi:hypothetical protein